jgi:hypothetical protein
LITASPYDDPMTLTGSEGDDGGGTAEGTGDSHWVRWHAAYDNPASPLNVRLRLVKEALSEAMDRAPAGEIRVISLCAGQGRDVIEVAAAHLRGGDLRALLVELDPGLVAFARARANELGVSGAVQVVEGDASLAASYAGKHLPAQVILVCGVLGNLSHEDVEGVVRLLPSMCAPGATVIWTRHRRPPDLTPSVRGWFEETGFAEVSFESPPEPFVLAVGSHRLVGPPVPFDPTGRLFTFRGDGSLPA